MRKLRWHRFIPAADWLRNYDRAALTGDLIAGVIITIMLTPQGLAYALLAGLPPQMGLYASILPLVVYALFGTSMTLAVGPVAVISLLTAAAASQVAGSAGVGYINAAILLAAMSGIVLVLMGLLRLGFLANFLSHPVISGFMSASGVLILVSQLKYLIGVSAHGQTLPAMFTSMADSIDRFNWPTLVVGLAAVGFLFWARRGLARLLQRIGVGSTLASAAGKAAPMIAVVVATIAAGSLSLNRIGVAVVGDIPRGLPALTWPHWRDLEMVRALLVPAVLIAIIGFVSSIAVAQTLAAKRRQRIDANRELLGLGAANIAAAFSGGFPVTGGFARSVVNFEAGAVTPLAGVFTAIGMAATVALLTPAFYYLPKSVLAATIVVAVVSLIDVRTMIEVLRYSRSDFTAMAGTVVVVLLVGVEAGLVTGVVLSLALYLWRTSHPHLAVVGQVPGTEHFRNVLRHRVVTSPAVLSVRVDESLYFANARVLEDRIYDSAVADPAIRHVVLVCTAINQIDASALESLETLAERLTAAGITLHLSEVKGPVMDLLRQTDFLDRLPGKVFLSQYQALEALDPDAAHRARQGNSSTESG